jgi:hypothetical protein
MYRSTLLLALFAYWVSPVQAADLTKIDRTIAKEPAYTDKPQYCLLVFGPEVKFRVWVVRDGKVLYVDRNGNGDLTEAGKRLAVKGRSVRAEVSGGEGQDRYNLELSWFNRANVGPCWVIEAHGKKYQYRAGRDSEGPLLAAERPKDAPVIHFDGPLVLAFTSYCGESPTQLIRDPKRSELGASIGTPGLGKGSFAYWLPDDKDTMKLQAEVEFIRADEKPNPAKLSLTRVDGGCCSFSAFVQVPEGATKAKVTISAPDWKGDKLAAITSDIPIIEAKPRR